MTATLLLLHLLNLVLPAAALAGFMVGLTSAVPGWRGVQPLVPGWRRRLLWTFGLNLAVLLLGLLWFRADGKGLTYAALLLSSALCQFVMLRGWRR